MSRIKNFIARGTVSLINAARKMQTFQMRLTAGEIKDAVEHFEPYGFTSHPHPGAEAALGFVNGDRSHCVALIVGDRRYRLTGLETGEVALFTDEGDSLVFKRGNTVQLTTKNFLVNASDSITMNSSGPIELHSGEKILLDAPEVAGTGAFSNTGNASIGGDFDVSGDEFTHQGKNVGRDHNHDGVVPGSGVSGDPV